MGCPRVGGTPLRLYRLGTGFAVNSYLKTGTVTRPITPSYEVCNVNCTLSLLRKCFQPRQWFSGECGPDPFLIADEDVFMWVYKEGPNGLFLVGYFAPDGTWFTESSFRTKEDAANRVNYLNGGKR